MSSAKTPKKRQYSKEQKSAILSEYFKKKASMIEIAQKYDIHPVTLAQWKRQMSDRNIKSNHSQSELVAEIERQKEEIERLKRAVANLVLDKEILQEAVELFKKSPTKKSK